MLVFCCCLLFRYCGGAQSPHPVRRATPPDPSAGAASLRIGGGPACAWSSLGAAALLAGAHSAPEGLARTHMVTSTTPRGGCRSRRKGRRTPQTRGSPGFGTQRDGLNTQRVGTDSEVRRLGGWCPALDRVEIRGTRSTAARRPVIGRTLSAISGTTDCAVRAPFPVFSIWCLWTVSSSIVDLDPGHSGQKAPNVALWGRVRFERNSRSTAWPASRRPRDRW
ncbi:hypothetical protein FB384_000644 [Prauserella sediminis]|uniref:Uncharacterized protein n=1 Tax=Prauserella sediminis TaxID=577680 RepID=A0A839XEN3_9PSEU|nr:hypothetical protein [Prauserella sediminis]